MIRPLFALLLALSVSACVNQPMGMPQASMATVDKIRTSVIAPVNVGSFVPAASLTGSKDKSVGIRALTLTSPIDGSFAKYFGKTLEVNLQAAGKFDTKAPLTLQGVLTDSDVSAGMDTGTAKLGAKISLVQNGTTLFEKQLTVDDKWPGAFIGAIAIPEAANHYTALYDSLVQKLFSDSDFLTAAKAK